MQNVHFDWNMDNFKFNFLLRYQPESLSLDESFLPLFKIIITMLWGFFGNSILNLPLLRECSVEIILKVFNLGLEFCFDSFPKRFCFKEEIIRFFSLLNQ